jgi:hypothetical protein
VSANNNYRAQAFPFGGTIMNDKETDQEPIPFMQKVLDNPFLLLFLGILVPAVFYIIWGIIEITQIPIAE